MKIVKCKPKARIPAGPEGTMWCSRHKDYLPFSFFYPSSRRRNAAYCKECSKEISKLRAERPYFWLPQTQVKGIPLPKPWILPVAPGHYTYLEWLFVQDQYDNKCCNCKESPATKDHVIPLRFGGSDNISNIQPLCWPCNVSKGGLSTDYRTKKVLKEFKLEQDEEGKIAYICKFIENQ